MAKLLLNLLKKKLYFKWKKKQQKAFKDLTTNLLFAPVWKVPNFIKLFEVHIDASDFIIGGILMQNGHPIILKTKYFMECNYGGQFMKKYCMSWCVASTHNYLGMHKTKVFMNNVSLRFFEVNEGP
jgi:hypothetical protein